MASGLYREYKRRCLLGTAPDLNSETAIKMLLIDTADYSANLTTHDFLDDVTPAGRVAGPVTLTSTTVDTPEGGVFDATDTAFTSVTGDSVEAVVIYHDTGGAESTNLLIAWVEFSTVTPNGGNINITFDSGSNRIFKL